MPKKKLPTGPIRIDLPTIAMEEKLDSKKQDSSSIENSLPESSQEDFKNKESAIKESSKNETNKAENTKKESNKVDSIMEESIKVASAKKEERIQSSINSTLQAKDIIENSNQESSLPENRIIESAMTESSQVESVTIEKQNQENTIVSLKQKPESSLLESKKVAMRLSSEAASVLRQFRAETGIPYEIIVDVMVRNWSSLPNRTKAGYLKQARQIRQMRLVAGQEKTLETMRQKYSEQS